MMRLGTIVAIFGFIKTSTTRQQIGEDIDGEAAGDYSGSSVSLSNDGSTIAIGATGNDGNGDRSGHVRIFQNNNNTWQQIGDDIDGERFDDESGYSISLSSDGSIVAVGSRYNDKNLWENYRGHVRIFQNINSSWQQIGEDIDGEAAGDQSGGSVSLSSDGSTIAIGATGNDGNGMSSGHVRIYQNTNSSWQQVGEDIDGEAGLDYLGHSISLSSDGSILAIGGLYNDGNGEASGHVRIFQNINSSWQQIGEDIDGEKAGDYLGSSVSSRVMAPPLRLGPQEMMGTEAIVAMFAFLILQEQLLESTIY